MALEPEKNVALEPEKDVAVEPEKNAKENPENDDKQDPNFLETYGFECKWVEMKKKGRRNLTPLWAPTLLAHWANR